MSVIWSDGAPGTNVSAVYYALTEDSGRTTQLAIDAALLRSAGGIMALNGQRVSVVVQSPTARLPLAWNVISIRRDSTGKRTTASSAISGAYPWISIACRFSDKPVEPDSRSYFQAMYASTYPGLDH